MKTLTANTEHGAYGSNPQTKEYKAEFEYHV